jgi:hypothetical protein
MSDQTLADAVLLVAAFLGTAWVLTPMVMFALGLTRFRILVSEEPSAAEPTNDDPDYERRYRQFRELGFLPIGTTIETCWFSNPIKWYRQSLRPLRWLATPDGRFLASFHRLLPTEPVRFGIVTLLSDSGMVRTTCPGVGKDRLEGNRLRIEVSRVEPAELFARHQEHVAAFSQSRGLAVKQATLPAAAALEEVHTRHLLPKLGVTLYRIPFSFFVLPTLVAVAVAARFGLPRGDWHTWAGAACVGTAAFALFRHVAFPRLFRRAVERRRATPA